MSHRLSFLNRVISLLLGLTLTVIAVWSVAHASGNDLAVEWAARIDHDAIDAALASQYFPFGLIVAVVVGVVAGGWLIMSNLRRHAITRVPSPLSEDGGEIQISAARVAAAVGEGLKSFEGVEDVRHSVAWDRGRPTATWLISAQPGVDMRALVAEIEQTDVDVHEALTGIELATSYKLHLRPVEGS